MIQKSISIFFNILLIIILIVFPIPNFFNINVLHFDSNYIGNKFDFYISIIYIILFIIVWVRNKSSEVLGWLSISSIVLSVGSFIYNDWNGVNFFPFILMYLNLISLFQTVKKRSVLNVSILGYYFYAIIPVYYVPYIYFIKDMKFYDTQFDAFIRFTPLMIAPFLILLFYILNKIKLNKMLLPICIFYLYALLTIVYTIYYHYYEFGQHMVWLLNVMGTIFLILSLLVYKIQNFNFKHFYWTIYSVFITISIVSFGKLLYYVFKIYENFDMFYKKGLYSYPTISYSNYTVAVLNVLFLYLVLKRKSLGIFPFLLLWGVQLLNSFVALSRGGMIAFISVLVIYYFLLIFKLIIHNKVRFLKIILINVVAFSVLALLFSLYSDTLMPFINNLYFVQRFKDMKSDLSVIYRFEYLKAYYESFKSSSLFNHIFGRGLSNQLDLVKRPHNIYILVLDQMGYVGLSIFIMIMGFYLYKFRSSSLFLVILYILIHSLFEPLLFSFWMDSLLVLFILVESHK